MLIMILFSIPAWLAIVWIYKQVLQGGIEVDIGYKYQEGARDSLDKYQSHLNIFGVYFVNIFTLSRLLLNQT